LSFALKACHSRRVGYWAFAVPGIVKRGVDKEKEWERYPFKVEY
jgi:hypothetical protein